MDEILEVKPERIEKDFKMLETFTDPGALDKASVFFTK